MIDFLFQMQDINVFLLLVVCLFAFSIIAMFFLKWFIPKETRYADNTVLGNISGYITIIYGVLAGLSALYLINNLHDTTVTVQNEANAVANLYRDSEWLKEPARSVVRSEIKSYLEQVINIEWPLMKQGQQIKHVGNYINAISKQLSQYTISNNSQMLIVQDMLGEIKTLSNSRESRIAASFNSLSPEIWEVILLGSILTLFINYLFGMNFYLHLITVLAATLMAVSMIFLLITLDKPFQGEYVIEADAFKEVLMQVNKNL